MDLHPGNEASGSLDPPRSVSNPTTDSHQPNQEITLPDTAHPSIPASSSKHEPESTHPTVSPSSTSPKKEPIRYRRHNRRDKKRSRDEEDDEDDNEERRVRRRTSRSSTAANQLSMTSVMKVYEYDPSIADMTTIAPLDLTTASCLQAVQSPNHPPGYPLHLDARAHSPWDIDTYPLPGAFMPKDVEKWITLRGFSNMTNLRSYPHKIYIPPTTTIDPEILHHGKYLVAERNMYDKMREDDESWKDYRMGFTNSAEERAYYYAVSPEEQQKLDDADSRQSYVEAKRIQSELTTRAKASSSLHKPDDKARKNGQALKNFLEGNTDSFKLEEDEAGFDCVKQKVLDANRLAVAFENAKLDARIRPITEERRKELVEELFREGYGL